MAVRPAVCGGVILGQGSGGILRLIIASPEHAPIAPETSTMDVLVKAPFLLRSAGWPLVRSRGESSQIGPRKSLITRDDSE